MYSKQQLKADSWLGHCFSAQLFKSISGKLICLSWSLMAFGILQKWPPHRLLMYTLLRVWCQVYKYQIKSVVEYLIINIFLGRGPQLSGGLGNFWNVLKPHVKNWLQVNMWRQLGINGLSVTHKQRKGYVQNRILDDCAPVLSPLFWNPSCAAETVILCWLMIMMMCRVVCPKYGKQLSQLPFRFLTPL